MSPYITGSKPKEQRTLDFCVGAKMCSGKASSEDEARQICSLPKDPSEVKPKKTRGRCKVDIVALTGCIIETLDDTEITQAKLAAIISGCLGQKVETPSREKFIKKCFKENAVTGDIKEAQKLRSMCTAKWKEQESHEAG